MSLANWIIFDLDGTLVDSRPAILSSLRHVQAHHGVRPADDDDLQWALGPPLREIMSRLLDTEDVLTIDKGVATYRAHHVSVCVSHASPFSGIREALVQLRKSGRTLFVCTSKLEQVARRVLEHFNLAHYFRDVYGSDLDGRLACKEDLLRALLGREHVDPARSVMVGDREHDVIGARAVGMRACAVTYGYGSAAEIEAAKADWLCDSPAQLPEVLLPPRAVHQPALPLRASSGQKRATDAQFRYD